MLKVIQRLSTVASRRQWLPASVTSGSQTLRSYSEDKMDQTKGEVQITSVLKNKFPTATFVNVSDISGGCGSMYEVQVESEEFRGKRTVLQHRMVTEALKAEIQEMHGLRISTAVPQSDS